MIKVVKSICSLAVALVVGLISVVTLFGEGALVIYLLHAIYKGYDLSVVLAGCAVAYTLLKINELL